MRTGTILLALVLAALPPALSPVGAGGTAAASGAAGSAAAQDRADAAGGLQSRLVAGKTVLRQGEPIEVKVLVRNASDKPVRYDGREVGFAEWGGWTLFEVTGPDGKSAPPIYATLQINSFYGQYAYPALGPGDEIQADAAQLEAYFYMRTPGKYRIAWRGTDVWPRHMTAIGVLSAYSRQGWEELIRQARQVAAPLPPPAGIEIEVVPAPGGGPDGDLVGRVLKVLPPGWQVCGAEILAAKVTPPGGKAGRGSAMALVHVAHPDFVPNMATLRLYVMADPYAAGPVPPGQGVAYLGRGGLGHIYLQHGPGPEFNDPLSRWNHAAHDLAVALDVTDPAPAAPARPDWGRMVSAILADCQAEAGKVPALAYFCALAKIKPAEGDLAAVAYEGNLVPPTPTSPAARLQPGLPYYRVALAVRPAAARGQPVMSRADRSIQWDGASAARGYTVERLGVDIVITVLTDDAAFARAVNAIVDRQVTSVLGGGDPPAAGRPAAGACRGAPQR
ncbi:MAG: hypothetical protein IMZ44_08350 [Planctomycetes bacterium]|nr:hypothetical protein [Planctomycetota bacterium]